jgi:hypothetical protein
MGFPTTSFPPGYYYASQAQVEAFYRAIQERFYVAFPTGVFPPLNWTGYGSGGVVRSTSSYNPPFLYPHTGYQAAPITGQQTGYADQIAFLQQALEDSSGAWVKPSLVAGLDGFSYTGWSWGPLGYSNSPAPFQYQWNDPDETTQGPSLLKEAGCSINPDTGLYDWTRQRPAEIADLSNVTTYANDVQYSGNTPVEGDIARYIDDGTIYQLTGGAWVRCVNQNQPTRILTGFGLCQYGDYVGHFLWAEMYGVLSRMTTTIGPTIFTNGSPGVEYVGSSGVGGSRSSPAYTMDDAYNATAAGWTTTAGTGPVWIGGYDAPFANVNYGINSGPPSYYGSAARQNSYYYAGDYPANLSGISRTVSFYGVMISFDPTATFDKLGDSIPDQDRLTLLLTKSMGTSTAAFTPEYFPSTNAMPPKPATVTPPSVNAGWSVNVLYCFKLTTWGFQYV